MPDLFADLTPPAVAPAGPVQDLDDLSAAPPAHFQGLAPQAPAPRVVAPLPGRSVDSTADIRTSIFERALQAAGELQPVSSRTHTLRVVNPRYEGPERFSVADQKKAILTGDTLGRKLRADLELLDTQGQVVHRRRTTLASIPYYTDRGTFINNGSEYSLANQMRLKPGVYTREKDNGEIEAHVNTTPGHGVPHRVYLERDTGVFKIKLGQASIPLVPLLQSLGVSTQQLRDAWGSDLATTNMFKTRGGDLEKIYERLVRGGEATEPAKMAAEIQQALADTKIDPEVSQHTLGKPYEHIDADVLLTTTRKLLAIHNRGNPEKLKQLGLDPAEQDDRDHLAFMRLLGPEDIIAERLRAGGKILRQALWRAGRKNSLAGMPPGILNRAVRGAILESGLGQVSEGVNPAQIFEQQMRVSRMGVGGIPSSDSVPASSRSVQPSHFGFIDPVSTPESSRAGVDSRLVRHLRKMPDGSLLGQFRDIRTGELVWKQPKEIFDSVIAFPGPMPPRPGVELDERGAQRLQQGLATGRIIKTESPETGEPRYWVPAMVRGKLRIVPAETVDVQLPHMEQAFSPLPNMVPLKSGMKGQRVAMAARMLTQSLPLENGESPLVQSGVPDEDDKSYEELYGERMGAIRAKQAGRVLAVTPDGIQVEYADGTQDTLETAQHLPNNVKTFFNQQATVQPGDTFEPGGLLARSNYVDKNGATALGLNARTGWMAFKGHNYEDAVVISESFAKRATSQHMYQHQVDVDPNEDQLGRSKFLSIFPGKFSKDQLGALDDDGIIRVGQKVEYGDPLVLMASHRHGRVGEISRAKAATWRDQSHTWDHETPGVVTDIARTRDGGVLVAVKTQAPSMVGDKFSGRHGNKGVAASVVPDDEMPIGADGKPLEVLYNPLGVISRCHDEQTEFLTERGWVFGRDVSDDDKLMCYSPETQALALLPQTMPFNKAPYRGIMLQHVNKLVDFCVTPDHRMLARCDYPGSKWQETTARRLFGHRWWVPVVGAPVPGVKTPFLLPHFDYSVKDTQSNRGEISIDAGDWAEFLGWYIAEGNTDEKVHISQSFTANPDKCGQIAELLGRLPFKWWYNPKNTQFHITSARLVTYMKQFGLCADKFIPEWVFGQPPEIRQRFLDAYWAGDGSDLRLTDGRRLFCAGTRSKQLADDLQRLFVCQGVSSAIGPIKVENPECPMWRCGRHFKTERLLRDGWSKIDYDGMIYCPTVLTGYVVTRRNGKLLISGNSNPSQVAEALLGKIAAATGKSYKVKDFEDIGDLMEFVQQELTKHGMTDTETVTDPETGKQIPGVLVGNTFVMKLHHMAAAKTSGRAFGAYTADNAPAKGGPEGSKTMGMLHLNALLSHGATGAIRDASLIRGQKNPEYWAAVMSGRTPPDPPVPFIYKKFINQLQAAGINPVRTGTRTHIMAMTNADINRLAEDRELQAPDTVDWRSNELQPIQGGLFDEKLFGGAKGGRWAKIKLAEPMLNPVMEEPARRLLGLTKDQLHSVIAGRMPLHGKTGPEALKSALAGLDVPREIEKARREINSGTVVKRDAATRRLGYLLGSQKTGVSPGDWVWDAVPVLPPQFRPISKMRGTGTPMVADANYLYRDLFELNKNLHQNKQAFDDIGDERLAVYDAIKAVTGLGDPVAARSQEQGIKGILKHVLGHSPKYSVMQRRLLGSTTDLVGRSTIIPNPDLDMDSVGIPETQAWKIYQPFIVRHMAKRGMPPERAAELVLQKHKTAREALLQVMQERPVMIDRAPVLHRYGVMAFWPRLTKSENLETSPIVIKGFGGDYDGDAMHYHVPADEGAVRDAIEKMLPSRNLLAVSDFKAHYTPSQEYLGGLYSGSTAQSNLPPIRFRTRREALSALRAHMVEPGRMVEIERADED